MPIYAYKCDACGHAKDVLQKIADKPLTVCPSCGAASFGKQVTAAGFQLKGSGWYATDFKGGSSGAVSNANTAAKPADSSNAKPNNEVKPASDGSKASNSESPTASAGSRGSVCACH